MSHARLERATLWTGITHATIAPMALTRFLYYSYFSYYTTMTFEWNSRKIRRKSITLCKRPNPMRLIQAAPEVTVADAYLKLGLGL